MLATISRPTLVFFGLFASSRLLMSLAGIAPDPTVVVEFWQHLDLELLHSDPLGSLWNLQMQPPLWNMVLAVAVAIAGPDAVSVTTFVHGFNIVLSALGGLIFMSMLGRLGAPRMTGAVITAAALSLPSTIYYENLVFYSHLTFFHVMLLAWLLLRVEHGGKLWPVFGALGVLVSLAWTWAIFHPLLVMLFGALLAWWSRGGVKAISAVALAVTVSVLPTVKNAVVFHLPSASSWIGLNLMQTAPSLTQAQLRHCEFIYAWNDVSAAPAAPGGHPVLTQRFKSSGHPNMNHAGLIGRSAECAKITKENILAHPAEWLTGRIEALVASHQNLPYNYDFNPLGWSVMKPLEQAQEQLGALGRSFIIGIYLMLAFWVTRGALRGERREFHFALLMLVGYFTFASHVGNGAEQQRMRYTIEPIYLLLTAEMLLAAWTTRSRKAAPTLKAAD